MTLGEYIYKVRQRRNMQQKQLAELTGTTQSMISALERDKCKPSEEMLAKICKALGVKPSQLPTNYKHDRGQMSISETVNKKDYVKKRTNGLTDLREHLNLTLRDVEEKTGLNNSDISLWERGMRNPPAYAYSLLCKAYNVTLEELLDAATNRPVDKELPKTPLEAARLRAEKSIAECAKLLGFEAATYQKVEDGTFTVTVGDAIRLAKFFDIEDFTEFARSFTKDGER